MIILKGSSNGLGVGILFTYLHDLLRTFCGGLILGTALHSRFIAALFFDASAIKVIRLGIINGYIITIRGIYILHTVPFKKTRFFSHL